MVLSRAGQLTWRRRVRCRVGCSFVQKKDSMLRLVIDARWTNRMCRPPPLSQLAVPGAVARLSASDESFDLACELFGHLVEAGLGTPGDDELVGSSIDLTDGFYQFRCQALASLFGPGYTGTAADIEADFGISIAEVFDDALQAMDAAHPSEVLEACFLGMAMGWSRALYFCNETISECMREALREVGVPDILVGDRPRPACFGPRAPAMAPCVDDADVLAVGRAEGRRVFELVLAAPRRRGFALRGRVDGEPVIEFLGMVLDGPRRHAGPVRARLPPPGCGRRCSRSSSAYAPSRARCWAPWPCCPRTSGTSSGWPGPWCRLLTPTCGGRCAAPSGVRTPRCRAARSARPPRDWPRSSTSVGGRSAGGSRR